MEQSRPTRPLRQRQSRRMDTSTSKPGAESRTPVCGGGTANSHSTRPPESSVRRAADRFGVIGQLIDAPTCALDIWCGPVRRSVDDMFDLQEQETASVVGAIEPNCAWQRWNGRGASRTEDVRGYDLGCGARSTSDPQPRGHRRSRFTCSSVRSRSTRISHSAHAQAGAAVVRRSGISCFEPDVSSTSVRVVGNPSDEARDHPKSWRPRGAIGRNSGDLDARFDRQQGNHAGPDSAYGFLIRGFCTPDGRTRSSAYHLERAGRSQ